MNDYTPRTASNKFMSPKMSLAARGLLDSSAYSFENTIKTGPCNHLTSNGLVGPDLSKHRQLFLRELRILN